MNKFYAGQIIEHDGLLAVVVRTPKEISVTDGHLAIWYGDPRCERISEGGSGGQNPEIWIVPMDCCRLAAEPEISH